MSIDHVKILYGLACFSLCLIIVSPTIASLAFFPNGESFSEIWLLGSGHMMDDYPFNVAIGEKEQIFVGVRNHMGSSAYYSVHVKLRNQTQAPPSLVISEPSPVNSMYAFRAIVADGDTWEEFVTFSLLEVSRSGDSFVIKKLSINDHVFAVDYSCVWNSENNGFFYQLFFELWIYDVHSSSFQYSKRFVGMWLNMTV